MEERSVHSSISDINSEETVKSESLKIPRKKRICLVGAASEDPSLGAAAQQFNVPVLKSQTGIEHTEDTTYCTYFIVNDFEGYEFDVLHKSAHRILGPTALLQLAEKKESLPSNNRPMYTLSMSGTVVVFTGFRKKDELTRLINMIHHMGGSIRKEMGAKVTHLIANCCGGEKYRYAVTFRVPIMSMNWVSALWDMKDDITRYGNNEELIAMCKLKPFYGAKVCFFGFPEEEKKHMCEVLQQQGGEPTEIDDPNCTHVVNDLGKNQCSITDSANNTLPYFKNSCLSLQFPQRISKTEPTSFVYYDPYIIPLSGTRSQLTDFDFNSDDSENLSSSSFLSSSEHDSAICMSFKISLNLSEKSDLIFKCLRAKIESPLDMSLISNLSQSIQDSGFSSLCEISLKKLSLDSFDYLSEMEIDESMYSSFENFEKMSLENSDKMSLERFDKMSLENFDKISLETDKMSLGNFGKTNSENFDKMSLENSDIAEEDFLNLSSYKSQSNYVNVDNKADSSRRYMKWRKSRYSLTITRIPKSRKYCKSKSKFHSKPKVNKSRYLKDSNTTALGQQRHKKLQNSVKLSNSFFTKACNVVLPSTFKQYMQVSPTHQTRDKILPRQKYTPLLSPISIPDKSARSSNFKTNPIHTFTPDKKINSEFSSSTPFDRRSEKAYRSRKDAKPVVVDESNVNALPDLASVRAHIVKAEWFWTSVQNEGAADEREYLFEDYLESVMSPSVSARRDSQQPATPSTASTRRKRKRLAETLSSLVQNGTDSPAVYKRRSSISDAGHLSVSGSFLDCTSSPDKQLLDDIPEVEAVTAETARKNLSPRYQVFLELVQTESNYVGILNTIMNLFKSPLEVLIDTSGELLNSTEVKIIFDNFPPIYDVHKKILEMLREIAANWTEEVSIGNIFLKCARDLLTAYPPYVNFFENTKEMLDQCDQNKPRFHAFLKICQTKPECGRQSLKELLIKPVQRLPSISLLLNDILKHTSKNNPDHGALEHAISSIKEVMTYINEDKRKTEGQLVMFDIFNEIDNCPPHLVSSHRSFIGKCEVMELSEGLSGRGDHLVLFLFTDTLEICKKRSKAFNSIKSPNTVNGLHSAKLSQGKPYKHIRMLSLSTIKKVVDIRETDECHKVFALMVRSNQELKEKLFSFTITDEEVNKTNYLRTLCRQMANTVCKPDADTFLISLDSHQLEIDTSDVALGTLSKAFKFASRTRMKVGRAFSFNKTPSKLKRAMSTMMSPFGSTTSLTPASQQLAQMRLASCNNLNELGNGAPGSQSRDDVLVAPMSVQPTRKAKCSTLSMASLRRNCSEEMIQDDSDL